jgi:hypothetical protein
MGKGVYSGTVTAKKPKRGSMLEMNHRLRAWLDTRTLHGLSKPALQFLFCFAIKGKWDTCTWRCGAKAIATQLGAGHGQKIVENGFIDLRIDAVKGVHAGNISRAIKELVDKGIIKMIKPRHEFYAATYELQTPKEREGGTNY